MVGGTIIEVHKERGKTRVWCMDRHGDECAIYVHPWPYLKVGDKIWWQGPTAYWTPAGSKEGDIPIRRIGFSFDPREQP